MWQMWQAFSKKLFPKTRRQVVRRTLRTRRQKTPGAPNLNGLEWHRYVRKVQSDSRPGRACPTFRVRRRLARVRVVVQHSSHTGSPDRRGRRATARRIHAVGSDTAVDKEPFRRKADDKRPGGNGCREARLPKRAATTTMPGARRWLLRVAEGRGQQTSNAGRDAVGRAVCLRWTLGNVAEPGGRGRPILYDYHDRGKRATPSGS